MSDQPLRLNSKKNNLTETNIKKLLQSIVIYTLILTIVTLILAPIYLLFKISVSAPQDILNQHPPFWIRHFTLEHWTKMLSTGYIWQPLSKSIIVATMTALLGVLIAAPGAYVISRLPSKIKYLTLLAVFSTRMFPEVGIALPISVTFIKWGLLDTNLGLVMAHLIRVLPLMAWILTGTFESIPRGMEEAAMVDGCNKGQVLFKVVFPLSASGIAAGAMLSWLESWNEFTYAIYLCLAETTLPIKTYYYISRGNWFESAAYAVALTVPVMIVTFILQKYLKKDYLAGGLKV